MSEGLPPGWAPACIGAVSTVNPSSTTVTAPDDQLVTFLPMAAVEELSGKLDIGTRKPFGDVKKGFTRFRDGDVLVAKITPSMENGKVAVAADLEGGIGCGTTEFHVIRPKPGVSAEYIRYFMVRSAYRQEAKRNMQGAVGQQRVPADFVRNSVLPVAPSGEQKRIVSKLDELFSRIDEGERALEQVSKLVERYRQSVLRAAVTGEITRDWRKCNKGKLESGEIMLARILKARREAWEQAELDKMKAKGFKPANENWKKKYKEPALPVTTDLPELPEGWVWASLDQLSKLITSGSRGWSEHYADHGSLFIRAQNIKHDMLELDDIAFVDVTGVSEGTRTKVAIGDLLVTVTGANVAKSAKVLVDLGDAYVSQHVALVRPVIPEISEFLFHWIVSPANGRADLLSAAYGAGKPGLSLEDLRELRIAIPSVQEQAVICDRVEVEIARLAKIISDECEWSQSASRLRQSVLRSAYRGVLVPQDANDEPASKLLQRIAAERTSTNTAALKRGRKKKSA